MQPSAQKIINKLSYISLAIYTILGIVYVTYYNNDMFMQICALSLCTALMPELFLMIGTLAIVYSCIAALFVKDKHYRICAVWTILLLLYWYFIPSKHVDAWSQETYYEANKDRLWSIAHKVDSICAKKANKFYIRKDNKYNDFFKERGLTKEDFQAIQAIIDTESFEAIGYYYDSVCYVGHQYQGLSLYGYSFGLHNKKLEDNYFRIIYNDTVSFDYSNGAFGPEIYPTKEAYLKGAHKSEVSD